MSAASRAARVERLRDQYLAENAWYKRAKAITARLYKCKLRRALEAECADIERDATDDAVDSADEEQCAYAYRGLSRSDFI
jgi:hypothetical protein